MSRLKLKRFRVTPPPPEIVDRYVRNYAGRDLHFRPDDLPLLSSESLFGNARPLVLDLGCGRGDFIVPQAAQTPDLNFVGFDWHWKSLWDAVHKTQAAGVDNVRLVRADFRQALVLVPDGAAAEVFLMFPPPVMAHSKHQQDTLTDPVIRQIHRVLVDGGAFHFVTDSAPYFVTKRALIADSGLFEIVDESRGFEGGLTRFQRFWEQFEIESKRLECRKNGTQINAD